MKCCGIDGTALVETNVDPLVGGMVDRYQIIRQLGHGAMGAVYHAKHLTLHREHALKVLHGDVAIDQAKVERFRREAIATSKIDHPNIVAVHDFGSTPEGLMFLVMEYIEGMTLKEVIQNDAPLSFSRIGRLTRQMAWGLQAAHEQGLVHRDLKPGNVMVVDGPDGEVAKVLDFGLVHDAETSSDTHRLTSTGVMLGTPLYMSPEQIHSEEVGASSDLYSLGVMLHEMLTGAPPFRAQSFRELIIKHTSEAPPIIATAAGLESIAAQLLEKDKRLRPEDAESVARMIERCGDLPEKRLGDFADLRNEVSIAVAATSGVRPLAEFAGDSKPRPYGWLIGGLITFATIALLPLLLSTNTVSPKLDSNSATKTPSIEKILPKPSTVVAPASPKKVNSPPTTPVDDKSRINKTQEIRPSKSLPKGKKAGPLPEKKKQSAPHPSPRKTTRPAVKPAAVQAQGEGGLDIVTVYQGKPRPVEVFVDGRSRGEAPLRLKLSPGAHTIEVRRTGAPALRKTVSVRSGQRERLVLDLAAK